MTEEKTWECPTCWTKFEENEISNLIREFDEFVSNRNCSPSLDPRWDEVIEKSRLLRELKSIHIKYIRKPTNMMQVMNAIGEQENATNQGQER